MTEFATLRPKSNEYYADILRKQKRRRFWIAVGLLVLAVVATWLLA